jgi:hypothetical protein
LISPDGGLRKVWEYSEQKVAKLIEKMPMIKWSGSSKGKVQFLDGIFKLNFDVVPEDRELVYNWTKEICLYRLHVHF